jgi:hypothetical protein
MSVVVARPISVWFLAALSSFKVMCFGIGGKSLLKYNQNMYLVIRLYAGYNYGEVNT